MAKLTRQVQFPVVDSQGSTTWHLYAEVTDEAAATTVAHALERLHGHKRGTYRVVGERDPRRIERD